MGCRKERGKSKLVFVALTVSIVHPATMKLYVMLELMTPILLPMFIVWMKYILWSDFHDFSC